MLSSLNAQAVNLLNMSALQERLEKALEYAGISKAELARRVGVTRGAVSLWFSGDTKELSATNLLASSKALGVKPLWLAKGTGSMIEDPKVVQGEQEDYATKTALWRKFEYGSAARHLVKQAFPYLRLARGTNVGELAQQSGLTPEIVQAVERGESDTDAAEKLAQCYGVTLKDLLDVKIGNLDQAANFLDRVKAGEFSHVASDSVFSVVPVEEETAAYVGRYEANRQIPVVGTAQLGENGYYEQLDYPPGHGDGYVMHGSKDPAAYVLQVRGDSMKPAIRHGWYVLVEPNGTPAPGEYVAIQLLDGRKMAKELLIQHRNGDIEVTSVNGDVRMNLYATQLESVHAIAAIIPPSQVRHA